MNLTLFDEKQILGCYKPTLLKMNLVLEIRKLLPQRVVDTPPLDPLLFPK